MHPIGREDKGTPLPVNQTQNHSMKKVKSKTNGRSKFIIITKGQKLNTPLHEVTTRHRNQPSLEGQGSFATTKEKTINKSGREAKV